MESWMIVWTNKDDGRGIWKEPEEKETKVGRYKEKKTKCSGWGYEKCFTAVCDWSHTIIVMGHNWPWIW